MSGYEHRPVVPAGLEAVYSLQLTIPSSALPSALRALGMVGLVPETSVVRDLHPALSRVSYEEYDQATMALAQRPTQKNRTNSMWRNVTSFWLDCRDIHHLPVDLEPNIADGEKHAAISGDIPQALGLARVMGKEALSLGVVGEILKQRVQELQRSHS